MHELLLTNGRVLDPAQRLDRITDVAVTDGRIVAIGPGLAAAGARRVIDVKGKLVTPGLIDPHVHIYEGVTAFGIHADTVGVRSGVTTIADAESAGPYTFGGIPRYVLPHIETDLFLFVNIARCGMAMNPEIESASDIDLDAAIQVVAENPGIVRGVKARIVSPNIDALGMELPRLALRVARETGTRAMFHIGHNVGTFSPDFIRQLLPELQAGDIITHIYTDNLGGVLDGNRRLVPEAAAALERGVMMDVGAGRTQLGFDAARRIMDQGIVAHSISSDTTSANRTGSVHSFVEMMTRFLALGLTLEEVVAMSTSSAARVLGIEATHGTLLPGRAADISVLDLIDGAWTVRDGMGATLPASRAVVPVLTVKNGRPITPDWGPTPWGWTPNPPVKP